MRVILIEPIFTKQRVSKEVNTDHFWYDHRTKELLKISGGKLMFNYDRDGNMTVSAAPVYALSYQSRFSRGDIMKWYEDNKDQYGLNLLDGGNTIAMSFNERLASEIEDSLYFHRFNYEFI